MCISRGKTYVTDQSGGPPDSNSIREAKVYEFDQVAIVVDHEVLWFQVSMQEATLMEILHRRYALIDNQSHRLHTKLLLILDKQFLHVVVQFFHDDVGVLAECLKRVDLRKMSRIPELQQYPKFFLYKDGFLYLDVSTLP